MKTNKKAPAITLEKLPIGEGREIQIREIPQEGGNLLRIGLYLDNGTAYSGATFPVQMLDQLIPALQRVRQQIRSRK
jgi:hypothetical protein